MQEQVAESRSEDSRSEQSRYKMTESNGGTSEYVEEQLAQMKENIAELKKSSEPNKQYATPAQEQEPKREVLEDIPVHVQVQPNTAEPGFVTAAVIDYKTPATNFQDANEAYSRDVRKAFSAVPKVKAKWEDRYMKILVVGESGQGKTTFIKNLFASYAQTPDLQVNDASGPTSKDLFATNPERLCTEIVVRDQATHMSYHYFVQDTPGYDNLEEHMTPILEYIEANNMLYLENEQNARRENALAHQADPRVDVCLYFIAPHRIKPVDVNFITQLSEMVPVVPILAKADSMTSRELADFRVAVRHVLKKASKDVSRPVVYRFPEDALAEAGVGESEAVPPFAVVASNTFDLSVGGFWPIREYPWGTCETMRTRHSDLAALKTLLFELSYIDLKAGTDERYYRFRQMKLLPDDNISRVLTQPIKATGRGIGSLVNTALKVIGAGAVLFFATSLLSGGQDRLREDVLAATDRAKDAANIVAHKAGDKAGEAKEVLADKAEEARRAAAAKTSQVKEAVAETFVSEEEKAKRATEARRKRRGPLGIFFWKS